MFNGLLKPCFAFYYRYCSFLNRILPRITLDGYSLRVFPGVCKPLDNEHLLVGLVDSGKSVLDVGSGSGVLTLFAALKSQHVTAVDISPTAIDNTRFNCQANGIENVTIIQSDMFKAVEGRFDYIISCPPVFRVPFASSDQQWCASPYFVDEFFKQAKDYLELDGRIIVMLPKSYDPTPQTLAERNGLEIESIVVPQNRSIAIRLHSIPYLHLNMDFRVFVVKVK